MRVVSHLDPNNFQYILQKNYDLSDLTIILTTYERPKLLLRQIFYMQHWNAQIEIVDGSEQALPSDYINLIKKLPNINYSHNNNNVEMRIADAAARVKTSYVIVLADDDFYLQSGLYKMMQTLEKNLFAGACFGGVSGFSKFYNRYYAFKYGANLNQYIIDSKKPSERIIQGFRKWRSGAWYALYRAGIFRKIWAKCELESSSKAIEEIQSVKAFYHAEFASVGDLYWLRGFANDSIDLSNNINPSENRAFSDWCTGKSLKNCVNGFVEINKFMFGEDIMISETEAKKVFQVIIEIPNILNEVSLIDINFRTSMIEKLAIKARKLRLFGFIISSDFWKEKITPFVLHLKRRKITVSNKNTAIEVKKILKYCKNFDVYVGKY